MQEASAVCDVCSCDLKVGQGFQVTTAQITENPEYWVRCFNGGLGLLPERCKELGISLLDAIGSASVERSRDSTPWLICASCFRRLGIEDPAARTFGLRFWETHRRFARHDAGPGSAELSEASAIEGFYRVLGPIHTDPSIPTLIYVYGNGYKPSPDFTFQVIHEFWFSGRPRPYNLAGAPVLSIASSRRMLFLDWLSEFEHTAHEIDVRHPTASVESFTVADSGFALLCLDRSSIAWAMDLIRKSNVQPPLLDIRDDVGRISSGIAVFFVLHRHDPLQGLPAPERMGEQEDGGNA